MRPLFFTLLLAFQLWPQQPPPSPVRFAESREHQVQGRLQLPGSVESGTISLVASEVAGLVVEYPVREGDAVKQGQVVARLNQQSLEIRLRAAEAQLKEAEARQKLAERNYERARELLEGGILSRQQYDDTLYEFSAWQGRIDNLKAEIDRIRYDLDRSVIAAPFTGVVVSKHTEVGQWLALGDPLLELLSLEDLEVVVNVPEQHFRSVRLGGAAVVTFEALPGREFPGKISAVIPRADPQARTFPVKVRLPNRVGPIGVGMIAQVGLPAGGSYRATIVPKDAVVIRGNERFVYLLNGDNTVSPVAVETGQGVGDWIEVRGRLSAGQRVVTHGNERLRPGQVVQGEAQEYTFP